MDGWDRITTDCTVSDSSANHNTVVAYYGLASKEHCQMLGDAHLWPDHSKSNLVLVDCKSTDIDDPKNILRLHRGIERLFDHKQVTFTQSGSKDFLLKVLNPLIGTKVLDDTSLTFNDMDRRPLILPNGKMPWRHLLATHSIIAHRHARDSGWLPSDKLTAPELNANDLMELSLGAEAQARVKRFL
jgi:hypothetical protein